MTPSTRSPSAHPALSSAYVRVIAHYALATLMVVVVTVSLWLLRDELTIANASVLYMLVTLITAVLLGTGPAVLAAVLSFFSFNYFLVEPYYTLVVEDTRELLDLVVFLAAALIASRLAAYARQQAEAAGLNAQQQDILYRLTSALNPMTDAQFIQEELRRVVSEELGATEVALLPARSSPSASGANSSILFVLVQAGDTIYGTLRAVFSHAPAHSTYRLLLACAGQAALALQRVELTAQAQRSRALAEADQLKTALLRAVSHDLRTPITIIKSSAANLDELQGRLTGAEQREAARTIQEQADALDRLVGNLLDMSRLQAGALVLNEDWNSLEEIAGDVAARAYQLHRAERIRLEFPEELPLVRCDYGLLLQALNNIVDNALRHEPPDQRVIIRGRALPGAMRLEVVNHGPTIPADEKARIMEPFYQSRDGASGGAGLGLAIARGIVEAHKGEVHVEDTPAGGATFVIILPQQEKLP